MAEKKKPDQDKDVQSPVSTRIVTQPTHDFFSGRDEPWRKWTVKPKIETMYVDPPEGGIGKRIASCRGQLDNLSVDALSRYTKRFDRDGVSRMSILRYEDGALPGARELRILTDTLWVPAGWLLMGTMEEGADELSAEFHRLFRRMLIKNRAIDLPPSVGDMDAVAQADEIVMRQKWIDEARKPSKS